MPNGYQGSPKEWVRISSPLEKIDYILEEFANKYKLPLSVNTNNSPNRELKWTFQIERIIQIYLEDENELTWSLRICANQFRNSINMSKNKIILKGVSIEVLQNELSSALEEAYDTVINWNSDVLGIS